MLERRVFQIGVVAALAIAVAALVVALRSDGGETATAASEPDDAAAASITIVPKGAAEVAITGFAYDPEPVRVRAGEAVAWANYDGGVPHTATAADGSWDSGTLELGEVYTVTFDEPGEYVYVCTLHPPVLGAIAAGREGEKLVGGGMHGMQGTVIVE